MPINQGSHQTAETEVLRELYAAYNRNDVTAALKEFDPNVQRIEWEGLPSEGRFVGFEEVKAHFIRGRSTWAEGGCEPEQFVVSGDKVVVFVYVRVRLKNKVEWNEGRVTDVFKFRNGKVIEMRSFMDRHQALDWAGVKNPN